MTKVYTDIPNYRQIKVKYMQPTDRMGARISICEPKRFNDFKTKRVYIPMKYSEDDMLTQALKYLESIGLGNIVARCHDNDTTTFLVDSWGEDFVELK